MEEFKGTQGEWVFKNTVTSSFNGVERIGIFPKEKQGFYDNAICKITVNESTNESEANAKLIACAPNLLDCLSDVLYAHDMNTLEYINFGAIRSLIKKATE